MGPTTADDTIVEQLVEAGMNVVLRWVYRV